MSFLLEGTCYVEHLSLKNKVLCDFILYNTIKLNRNKLPI